MISNIKSNNEKKKLLINKNSNNNEVKILQANKIAIKQNSQFIQTLLQSCGIPYEEQNQYEIKLLSTNYNNFNENYLSYEQLNNLEKIYQVEEESSIFTRSLLTLFGIKHLRNLKLKFKIDNYGNVLILQKPLKAGGICCGKTCNQIVNVYGSNDEHFVYIGRVRENFDDYFPRLFDSLFKCIRYNDIEISNNHSHQSYTRKYQIETNVCCCGTYNNCCKANCLFPNTSLIMPIRDINNKQVGQIKKIYARNEGLLPIACCRDCCGFSNYILEFPHDSTIEERYLILSSIFHIDFQNFEPETYGTFNN